MRHDSSVMAWKVCVGLSDRLSGYWTVDMRHDSSIMAWKVCVGVSDRLSMLT